MNDDAGRRVLLRYYRAYLEIAQRRGLGIILDSPTWRSNTDWGNKLGYSKQELASINKKAIRFIEDLRILFETEQSIIVVDGVIGPRGDGYVPSARMSAQEAASYHSDQISAFAESSADMITALTMNYVEEAVGIAMAAKSADIPIAISFTVETDGRLPTGQSLQDAIKTTDAATGDGPIYVMPNSTNHQRLMQVTLRFALPACGRAWTMLGSRKNSKRGKCLKMPQNPTRQVHALLGAF